MEETGTIEYIVWPKLYGFIARPDGDVCFFHATNVSDGRFGDLREGMRVVYTVKANDRRPGWRAVAVQPATAVSGATVGAKEV